jgi:hypothetical protein
MAYKFNAEGKRIKTNTEHRFNAVELGAIEMNADYWRTHASPAFYERLERTLDDAMKDELYERAERVRRVFIMVTPREAIEEVQGVVQAVKEREEIGKNIMSV